MGAACTNRGNGRGRQIFLSAPNPFRLDAHRYVGTGEQPNLRSQPPMLAQRLGGGGHLLSLYVVEQGR